MPVQLRLGVKSDPIEYRYSHPWLFRLLAEEDVRLVQLGTFFEIYQLPDAYFLELRRQAEDCGVRIESIFTAHRELGGFFRDEPGYEAVARKNFERLIEVGRLVGAAAVGSNPGAVMRDQMDLKPHGVACYLRHMKELMHFAKERGLSWLTIEPMSCLAEPPTLPDEIRHMGEELRQYHRRNASSTVQVGYCTDIAHGYIDQQNQVRFNHLELFEATLPYLYEVHLKNTDARFNSTFGFSPPEREKGIVDVSQFRRLLLDRSADLPVTELTGYLEIGGPKLGRDYSDSQLEQQLRESLRHLKRTFLSDEVQPTIAPNAVLISPSMMCADPLNFEAELRQVEAAGVDRLHMDIMDGHFVPNMPMGLSLLEHLRNKTRLPLDVHLMVEDNDFFVELLSKLGVYQISVHVESAVHLDRTLARIRETGAKAGAAINPGTPLAAIEYVLERLDYVLIMTVNPGYAGQAMTPASLRKIADCRDLLAARGLDIPIQVDGNVSFENIPAMVAAGAANLVAGTSSLFKKPGSLGDNLQRMRAAIDQGLANRSPR